MVRSKRFSLTTGMMVLIAIGLLLALVASLPRPVLGGRQDLLVASSAAQKGAPGQDLAPILGLEHVALNVRNPAGVVAWCVENLDMKIARKVGGASNTHFLADSLGKSMLEVYHNPDVPVPDYNAMDPLVLHIAFNVQDVRAARERLLAAGATAEGDVTVTESGDELAMLRSPHGLAVQLTKRAVPMLK